MLACSSVEKRIKALEKCQSEGSVKAALRLNLTRPINMFDPSEAVEQLEALARVAQTTLHEKSDEYGAILDEVRDRQFVLPPPALRRLLFALLGDPVRANIA